MENEKNWYKNNMKVLCQLKAMPIIISRKELNVYIV